MFQRILKRIDHVVESHAVVERVGILCAVILALFIGFAVGDLLVRALI